MELFITLMGTLGGVLCILSYFLLERGTLSGEHVTYYVLNGVGAVLVLVAVLHSFDGGDMGAIVQEVCWAVISLMGIVKVLKVKKNKPV